MLSHKEIAERGRRILSQTDRNADDKHRELVELFNKLDPPEPEPGTVVWWRYGIQRPGSIWNGWHAGLVTDTGDIARRDGHRLIGDFEWKPARILAPDEVAVKVPPVSEWPNGALRIDSEPYYRMSGPYTKATGHQVTLITRAEAERMEATE